MAVVRTQDSCLALWDLPTRQLQCIVDVRPDCSSPGGGISFFKVSGALAAVALRNGTVCLVDILAGTVIRSFGGSTPGPGNMLLKGKRQTESPCLSISSSFAFSPDNRWLAGGCADGTLWVYDILGATVIDWLRFKSPPTTIAFDPTGAALLTAHSHTQGRRGLRCLVYW